MKTYVSDALRAARARGCMGGGGWGFPSDECDRFSKDFEAYELHNNSLTELFEFEILAESGNSVQAITHKEKDIYGIIFHPEVRNENIILNFVNL